MIHRCDGHQDCLDYSDEQDCPSTNISLQIQPERQTVRQGQEAVFRCRDEGDLRVPVRWVREGNRPLPPESIDNRGRLILFNVQINYSGVYICKADINIDVNGLDTSSSPQSSSLSLAQKAAYLTVQPSKLNHLRFERNSISFFSSKSMFGSEFHQSFSRFE